MRAYLKVGPQYSSMDSISLMNSSCLWTSSSTHWSVGSAEDSWVTPSIILAFRNFVIVRLIRQFALIKNTDIIQRSY